MAFRLEWRIVPQVLSIAILINPYASKKDQWMDSSYNIKSFTVAMIKVVPLIEARSPTRVRAQVPDGLSDEDVTYLH